MTTISKKTHSSATSQEALKPHEHFAQFYQTDAFLLDSLSTFITTGLSGGDACIVVATQSHHEGLEARLKTNGLDLSSASTQDKYFPLDAEELLSQFMVEGQPDPTLFASAIGNLIEQAASSGRQVRIFGEMVSLLWDSGNQGAAIRLEELWNDLQATTTRPFLLFCAYAMPCFAGEENEVSFTEICQRHSRIFPDESYTLLSGQEERLRAITLLQQKAISLQTEITERQAAEERLRISEIRYRRLFEASRDAILIVDPLTAHITDANPAMTDLLDCPRELILGKTLWHIGLFADRETTLEFLRELQTQQEIRYDALPLLTKDKQPRFVEFVSILYQEGNHEVIQCNLRDITDRLRAEEERLYLASLVSSSDDAILSKDLDGIITSWNTAAERLYGYSAQEIVGQPVTVLFAPDRQDEFQQIMSHIRRGERVDHFETQRMRKDGTFLTVSVTISPIKDRTDTIIGVSAIARDITEHRQLEAKFRQLFDSNLIGVFISDFAGTFLDANNAFLQLLGYTREELLAGTIHRDILTPTEFHPLSQDAVKALQVTGTSGTYEKEYLHKSGKRISVLVAVTRIAYTETCIGFVLDISERKALDERKDEFISMASHELKTPVTSLKGFLTLLQRRLTPAEHEKELHYLARMVDQVNKLTKLIDDLLDLSKMQNGQLVYREECFAVDTLVQEIVENVQETTCTHRILLEGHTQMMAIGDRDRIGQVLINLLNNAIKYSPQADTVITHLATDQNEVHISVQDFGIGIAQQHQDKIFERFYQVTDPTEKTYPGLGIGLYISTEIIKRHRGHLWMESEKDKGTTFHITLPPAEKS
jgi:PAS domain S-box-containing protein